MNTHSLDAILGTTDTLSDTAPDARDVIAHVRRVLPSADGALVEIKRTDVVSGQSKSTLVRLRADGSQSVTVGLTHQSEALERNVITAMLDGASLGIMIGADGVWNVEEGAQSRTTAINALGLKRVLRILEGDSLCVVLAPGALHLVRDAGGSVELSMAPLALGGWRHLGQMHVSGETLYAAVTDPVAGFDLFQADLTATKPSFSPLLGRGAHRFALNAAISSMCHTDRGLLLGTAALAAPAKAVGDWGPELLLVTVDGKWDLIAGQPRFSPVGLLLPASSLMPGMGQPDNAAVTAMTHRDGQTFIAIQEFVGPSVADRRAVTPDMFDYRGAVRLYRSAGLEDWEEIPHRLAASLGPISAMGITTRGIVMGYECLGDDALPIAFAPFSRKSG